MKQLKKNLLQGAIYDLRMHIAREQAAMHTVNMAVARWRAGYSNMDSCPSSSQSRWHAAAQSNFMRWLSAGGFAQAEPETAASDDGAAAGSNKATPATAGKTGAKRQTHGATPRKNCTCAA